MITDHDIVMVGGGGAGLRAAIAIAETNPSLSVAVVSKVYPMRSHTVAAEGGAAAVIKDNDSLENHINDTIAGGDWMCDQDAVELFVNEAPRELIQMEHWGCPWSRETDGTVATRPFGGMKIERTWFAADKTGFHMLHTLFQTSLKYNNITRYDEWFATKILVENGRCQGVAAIELRSGKVAAITGRSVIMCTGGAGRVFPFTTNGAIKTGDGMSMAYRAGVPLKAMEFIQGMSSQGCAQVTRGKYSDQQYLGLGSVMFALGSTSGITYFQNAIEEGYNGNWEVSEVPHTTSEPVLNLYGGGLIMGDTGDIDRMVAAYQWMKFISNTDNSAVWSTESGYGFVRSSSADHPLIVKKRNSLAQYNRSLGLIQYGKGEPSVPGYYSVRGEVEKAYAAIINGDDIVSTLNDLNDEANAILADAIAQ